MIEVIPEAFEHLFDPHPSKGFYHGAVTMERAFDDAERALTWRPDPSDGLVPSLFTAVQLASSDSSFHRLVHDRGYGELLTEVPFIPVGRMVTVRNQVDIAVMQIRRCHPELTDQMMINIKFDV